MHKHHPHNFFSQRLRVLLREAGATGAFIILLSGGRVMAAAGTSAATGTVAKSALAAASGPASTSVEAGVEFKTIDDPDADFRLKYPVGWTVDSGAKDYDKNTNFTLLSPKSSSVQVVIMNKADDPKKVVDSAVKKIDNVQITTLSRTNLTTWGPMQNPIKGVGQHLKGKIVDSFPGGIKVFCFSSPKHNVLIIETYFSDDLKDVQADIDFIGKYFEMKK